MEDNHKGAIYVFHGFQGSLLKTPKQVALLLVNGQSWDTGP